MINKIDARGKKCPLPIILTKKCVDKSQTGDIIEVMLDNEVSKNNLESYISELGYSFQTTQQNAEFVVTFVIGENLPLAGVQDITCPIGESYIFGNYITVIKSDCLGSGERELGQTLMRSYLNSMTELESLPKLMIFYNSGVKLVNNGVDTVATLKELERRGVEIICCGVCCDYYKIDLAVGKISNMFKIGTELAKATKIVYP